MIEISVGYWIIPTIITVIGIAWVLFVGDDTFDKLLSLIVVLIISLISWVIFGVLN